MDRQTRRATEVRLSLTSLAASCALLAAAILPTALLVAWIASGRLSAGTFTSAALGGGVCWLAAALALAATFLGNRFHAPVQAMLVGMIFRMGLPLVAILGLPRLGGPLADSHIPATILGVYLVALVVETVLSLRMIPSPMRAPNAP